MYDRLMSDRRGYKDAFLKGLDELVSYACEDTVIGGKPYYFGSSSSSNGWI